LLSVAYVREKDKRVLCICLAACIASFQQNTLFPREIAILQPPIKVALFTSANVVIFSSPPNPQFSPGHSSEIHPFVTIL
jgi:hypothetical protein